MAGNLLNTYIIGFDRAIRETVETKGGKMRQYIQTATGDLFRKEGVYQRTTGGGLPSKVVNRFGDSPVSDIDYLQLFMIVFIYTNVTCRPENVYMRTYITIRST